MCLCAREEQALCLGDELFRPGGSGLALLGLVLLVMWLLGFVAFQVSTGVIHTLLGLAVISILMRFLAGRTGGSQARRATRIRHTFPRVCAAPRSRAVQ